MALNFPDNPQTGDTYLAPNNQLYLYDGEKWIGFVTPAGTIAQGITFVGDDSTGTRVSDGESFKITGSGSVTTAVSGDTITITGSASAQGITFVGDDSSGTRVSDGESFKIAGTQNVSTAVSGDTLTITGPNLSSYATQSYVTSQGYITNSPITVVGDDSTGVTLNSGETIKIAGTQNISTAVSGDTLTITGINTGDFAFSGNTLSTTSSNADIELDPAGTGNLILKSGNFLPAADNTQYLGSASKRWHTLYVGPGSININGVTISESAGKLNIPSGVTGTQGLASIILPVPSSLPYSGQNDNLGNPFLFANDTVFLDQHTYLYIQGKVAAGGIWAGWTVGTGYPESLGFTPATFTHTHSNGALTQLTLASGGSGLSVAATDNIMAFRNGDPITTTLASPYAGILGTVDAQGSSQDTLTTINQLTAGGTFTAQDQSLFFDNINLQTGANIVFSDSTTQNTAARITVVGDDSTGVTLNAGETIKIAGSGSITTAVSGDTLTITGSASAQGITFVGDDSSGTRVSDGESFKITGTQNITTAVSGDTLTITGPDLSSYLTAVPKTIDVNAISSSDSSAIEINDAVNLSGLLTANAGLTINNNSNTWSFGSTGTLTVPANGIITAPNAQEFQLQAKDTNSVLRNEINLDPNNGTYMSVWSPASSNSFSTGDWGTASWVNESGVGVAYFTNAENLQDFWTTGVGSFENIVIEVSINSGSRVPVTYDGNNGEQYGVTLILGNAVPVSSPTTITSLTFYYQTKNRINIDYDGGEILIDAQSMNIKLQTTELLDLRSGGNLNIRGLGQQPVRIYTDNPTHMWEFDTSGSLTLPREGKINGIGDGGPGGDRYGYMTWDGNSSAGGLGWNTMKLVPDTGLESVDTYIILDPAYVDSETGSIHIRAGGTLDNSLAHLCLGGENSHVKIGAGANPPVTVKANNNSWTFGTDGTLTFPDSTTQNTAARITIVGDDSTGVTLNAGETIKIAGAGSITTAVSGDTITITGTGGGASIGDLTVDGTTISSGSSSKITLNESVDITGTLQVNDINSADSSAIQINDGVNVSGTLTANTIQTNQISSTESSAIQINDSLNASGTITATTFVTHGTGGSITGVNTLQVNEISSADSTAVQINDGVNVSGTLTANTFVTNNISSSESSAIQVDDAINFAGAGTFHGSVRFNAGYTEKINALTASSTITVNCATASIHTVTLTASTGFVITSLPTGGSVTVIITQGGSGSYTATFGTDTSTTVKFPGGAPTLSTAVSAIDVVTIFNDGTNYLGNIAKAYA
jgi:hypothetical protein